jgi:succinoglycan biosynthesis transport protein ExoP
MNPLDGNNKPLVLPQHPASSHDSQWLRPNLTLTGPVPMMPVDPNAAQAASGSPTMGALLQAIRRRWLVAFPVAILTAAVAVGALLLVLPVRYTVQAAVQIHSKEEIPVLPGLNVGTEPDFSIIKANQAALIKSPLVLLAAVNRLKDKDLKILRDYPNPVKWLETAIKTDFLIGPEILRITLSGDDPQEVTALINAVVEAFLDENKQKEDDRRRKVLDLLEANRQKSENSLRQKQLTLRKILEARGLDDIETLKLNYQQAQQNLGMIKKDLLQAQLELVQGTEELRGLQEKEKTLPSLTIPDFLIDRELEKMPQGKIFFDQLGGIMMEIQLIQSTVQPGEVQKYLEPKLQQRANLVKEMGKVRNLFRPEIENKLRAEIYDLNRAEAFKAQDKINGAKKKKELLEEELRRAEKEVRDNNPNSRRWPADVEALRDDATRLDVALTKLGETIQLIQMEPAKSSRVSPWQRAEVPSNKDYSRQIKFGGAAGLGGFCLALFGIGFLEFRVRRISGVDQVQRGLGMSVVGTLPRVPVKIHKNGQVKGAKPEVWQNQLSEAVDSIRTMLLHAARAENLHIVMITSAVGGEGKTSLATQLAASLARSWRKTLLIDGDLRNPAAHKVFGLSQEPGFSEVLRGEANPPDVIKPTSLSRLWLMPAGQWDSHAVQALAQDNVRSLLEALKQQYDFIIVDSCPVLPVADSLSLGQHVDGVLFSVLRDVSRVPALQAAQQRLSNLGIRTLGAVVIGTKNESGNHAYHYALPSKGS